MRHLAHHTAGLPPPPYFARRTLAGRRARRGGTPIGWLGSSRSQTSSVGRAPPTRTRTTGTRCSARSWPARAARPSPPTRTSVSFAPLGMTDSFFRDAETPLPERAARGHFDANDGTTVRRARAVPRGGRGRALDDRGRPRALGRGLLRRGARRVAGSPSAAPWTTARRSTTRGASRCARTAGSRSTATAARSRDGPRRWSGSRAQRTTVIVLANREDLDVSALAFETADDVLGERPGPRGPARGRHVRRRALTPGRRFRRFDTLTASHGSRRDLPVEPRHPRRGGASPSA